MSERKNHWCQYWFPYVIVPSRGWGWQHCYRKKGVSDWQREIRLAYLRPFKVKDAAQLSLLQKMFDSWKTKCEIFIDNVRKNHQHYEVSTVQPCRRMDRLHNVAQLVLTEFRQTEICCALYFEQVTALSESFLSSNAFFTSSLSRCATFVSKCHWWLPWRHDTIGQGGKVFRLNYVKKKQI